MADSRCEALCLTGGLFDLVFCQLAQLFSYFACRVIHVEGNCWFTHVDLLLHSNRDETVFKLLTYGQISALYFLAHICSSSIINVLAIRAALLAKL